MNGWERRCPLDPLYDPSKTWTWTPEGGESQEDVRLRVGAVLDTLRTRYPQAAGCGRLSWRGDPGNIRPHYRLLG